MSRNMLRNMHVTGHVVGHVPGVWQNVPMFNVFRNMLQEIGVVLFCSATYYCNICFVTCCGTYPLVYGRLKL